MKLPNMIEAKKRTKQPVEYIYLEKENYNQKFKNKKFFLRTYGCQMNVHDSENIKSSVEKLGFELNDNFDSADLIILNTCAIRENAHDKVWGYLGRCKHLKQKNPNLIIVLTGCMPQQESVIDNIKNKYPYIDIIIGTHNLHNLPKMIENLENKQEIEVFSFEGNVYENLNYKRDSKVKAWVNIMFGCNNFCTYCIVPYTRGKQRSRKHIDIIEEIKKLVKEGYKEVTLLGQNVNSYGIDLENEISFAKLLELVSDTKIERIRFVTSNPWDFSDETIEVIKNKKNVMPYVHLPIQSGSNNILEKMNRHYTKEEYLKLFKKIKTTIPNVSVTTDIIVGFPNEKAEDFAQTLEVVKECKFDGAFTFVYSKREETIAAKFEDIISSEEKEQRLQILNDLVNKYALENNQKYLNKEVLVLVEGLSEKDNQKLFGYTDTMKLVNIKGTKNLINKIIKVRITDAKSFSLDGEAII